MGVNGRMPQRLYHFGWAVPSVLLDTALNVRCHFDAKFFVAIVQVFKFLPSKHFFRLLKHARLVTVEPVVANANYPLTIGFVANPTVVLDPISWLFLCRSVSSSKILHHETIKIGEVTNG